MAHNQSSSGPPVEAIIPITHMKSKTAVLLLGATLIIPVLLAAGCGRKAAPEGPQVAVTPPKPQEAANQIEQAFSGTSTEVKTVATAASQALRTAVGWLNGFIIVKFGIPSLVVTIGTQFLWRGAVLVLTQGGNFSLGFIKETFFHPLLVGKIGFFRPTYLAGDIRDNLLVFTRSFFSLDLVSPTSPASLTSGDSVPCSSTASSSSAFKASSSRVVSGNW